MKRLFALAALLLVSVAASAQAAPTVTVSWTNPTLTVSGGPLTGVDAITKYQFYFSNTPIGVPVGVPTFEVSAVAPLQTSYVYTGAKYGETVYTRMCVCNSTGCSAVTNQVQAVIPFPASAPGTPQNFTIAIKL